MSNDEIFIETTISGGSQNHNFESQLFLDANVRNGNVANFEHTVCIATFAYGGKSLTSINLETN